MKEKEINIGYKETKQGDKPFTSKQAWAGGTVSVGEGDDIDKVISERFDYYRKKVKEELEK